MYCRDVLTMYLQYLQDAVGSQQVLLNSEMYGQYLAASLRSGLVDTGNKTEIRLTRDNIGEGCGSQTILNEVLNNSGRLRPIFSINRRLSVTIK